MPTETIHRDPELFVNHMGLKVYQTYEDDDFSKPELFHFTADPSQSDSSSIAAIDVREWCTRLHDEQPEEAPPRHKMKPGYFNSPAHAALVEEWRVWWEVTSPAIIKAAVIEGIEKGKFDQWLASDMDEAMAQGWELISNSVRRRPSPGYTFSVTLTDDQAALDFVLNRAQDGNALCLKALRVCGIQPDWLVPAEGTQFRNTMPIFLEVPKDDNIVPVGTTWTVASAFSDGDIHLDSGLIRGVFELSDLKGKFTRIY